MILFLDFDGVLHPDEAYLVKGRPVLRAEGALFMWAPLLADTLKNYPGLQIVLSTSWARDLRFARARSFLPPDLQQRVIGATWHSRMAPNDDGDFRTRNRNTWWDKAIGMRCCSCRGARDEQRLTSGATPPIPMPMSMGVGLSD